jgi:hypothetical protein
MKLRELQRSFRGLKKRESSDKQAVRDAWEKWWDAHRHPRNSAENASLAQYDAAYFSQHIVRPLRKKAVESEAKVKKYKKWAGILRLFLRVILSFCIFIPSVMVLGTLVPISTDIIPSQFGLVLMSLLAVVVINCHLVSFVTIGSVINFLFLALLTIGYYMYPEFQKILQSGPVLRPEEVLSAILFLSMFAIVQYIAFALIVKCISKVLARHKLSEETLLCEFQGILASVREFLFEEFKKLFQALLELHSRLIATPDFSFLRYWCGCTTCGGIPASTEAHGLSLLSTRLSTFDVFASLFFPAGKHFRIGGGNNGLVPG